MSFLHEMVANHAGERRAMTTTRRAVTLVILTVMTVTQGSTAAVVNIAPEGTAYENLPGIDSLAAGVNSLELTIEVSTLRMTHPNGSLMLQVAAPMYVNDLTGETAPYGPCFN